MLLDVDGVINDLGSLRGVERPYRVDRIPAMGFVLHIPDYMPELIRSICDVAEVRWCTTWEHAANEHVSPILGVGELPVLELDPLSGWKLDAALPVLTEADDEGRSSFWIEDFDGVPSELPPSTTPIDTTAAGVLRSEDLPPELR